MPKFLPFTLLTANDLNAAFAETANISTTAPQQFKGQINVPVLDVGLGLTTTDLTVTGNVVLATTDAMIVPVGTTLQRPFPTAFGQLRGNSTTGTYELALPNGSWAQISTTAAATVIATAPANLAAPSFGPATAISIPVVWQPPTVGSPPYLYTLQYRAAGTSNWINWLTDIPSNITSATVSGLLDSTRYEFRLSVRNTAGSTTSPITSAPTLGFNPGGPANLTPSNPTSSTVTLTWSAVATSPVAYQVRYAAVGTTTWVDFAQPTSDTFTTVYGLLPNQAYTFEVQSKNTSGSFESTTVQASTLVAATSPPNAPNTPTVSAVTLDTLTLNWFAPSTGTGPFAYQVSYQVSGSGVWTDFKTPTTATTQVVTQRTSATNYLLQVTAINSAGLASSASALATTLSATPVIGSVVERQTTQGFPSLSGPILGMVATSGALSHLGITVDDPPAAYLAGSMIISVTCGSGTVTMIDTTNNPIQGSGTNTIGNFPTTLAGAQSALASLTYTAGGLTGTDSIRVSVTDQLTQIATMTINITVATGQVGAPSPTPPPGPPSSGSITPTGQPTNATGITASRCNDLTSRIAVVTRLENASYNAGYTTVQAAVVENQINYIGNGGYLRIVRELCAGNMNPSWLAQVAQNCGSFDYILAGDTVSPSLYSSVENDMLSMALTFPYVRGFEGFNPGSLVGNLVPAITQQASINALASANDLESYQLAPDDETVSATIGQFSLRANIGTSQAFLTSAPNASYPPLNDVAGGLHEKLIRAEQANPGSTNAIVAFGYQTFFDGAAPVAQPGWVAQTVAAKYMLEGILDAYNLGAYYIGLHELQDADQAYGLFSAQGSPKGAAQALRIMFQLMADSNFQAATFLPGKLAYTITSTISQYGSFINTGLQQLLLQSAGGTFYLWLWNEQPLNDSATNATIAVPNINVTVSFTEHPAASISIYDPFNPHLIGGVPQPYLMYVNPSSILVSLPAWPICLAIRI
jgi:hypothetical protein